MSELVDLVRSILSSPVTFVLALIVLVAVTHHYGYEVEYDPGKKLPRIFARNKRETAQLRVAFERIAEVGKGLRGVVEATDAQVDEALDVWFRSLCLSIAWTLATNNDEVYRVVIWTKDSSDAAVLRALAWHMMPDHVATWQVLDRNTSLAGKVMRDRQPYYSKDVLNDAEYVRRNPDDPDPNYASVYALPLGDREPWGAMTISAKAKDGFTEQDRQIAVQFGGLASIGAAMGPVLRRHPGPGPSDTEPDTKEAV